ncbi:hypothetical protein CY34DRAFT_19232 [Suillus luteus UH-Slu-Lm8-n1]|uniref:Uncharacterized protein n=1 Tax=Suillus luteus UH-Slu-Lm8-n1 TaxID=930992 RepID=A0A0D0AD13_9AGAM|nr:hypothetical protein CY34DRAFT_19232 [Suillus luteus UH-Slu-Lm8-n1]
MAEVRALADFDNEEFLAGVATVIRELSTFPGPCTVLRLTYLNDSALAAAFFNTFSSPIMSSLEIALFVEEK